MRIHLETYGCAVNQADSERIASALLAAGHSLDTDADVVIVNTCTVKGPTERKIRRRLGELRDAGKRVLVAGCLPAAQPEIAEDFPEYAFIGVNAEDAVSAVNAMCDGAPYRNILSTSKRQEPSSYHLNPVVEIVPISAGCLGECAYCITKKARGHLRSRSADSILRQIRSGLDAGVREVWLTSQDTGCWGADIGSRLPQLLADVCAVEGDFTVRVGMMNPDHAHGMLDDLVAAFAHEKIYDFVHVPVQAGSDTVLADMGRTYTVSVFEEVVAAFRKNEDFTISTDVICGYPTESEEDFQHALDLIGRVTPDVLNISRYWPRPHTRAASLKPLPGAETKARSRKMNLLFKQVGIERNKRWIGWQGPALVSARTRDYTARNYAYKPIVIAAEDKDLLGETLTVEVTDATHFDLRGKRY